MAFGGQRLPRPVVASGQWWAGCQRWPVVSGGRLPVVSGGGRLPGRRQASQEAPAIRWVAPHFHRDFRVKIWGKKG